MTDVHAAMTKKVAKDPRAEDPKKIYFMRTQTARETGVDAEGNP